MAERTYTTAQVRQEIAKATEKFVAAEPDMATRVIARTLGMGLSLHFEELEKEEKD